MESFGSSSPDGVSSSESGSGFFAESPHAAGAPRSPAFSLSLGLCSPGRLGHGQSLPHSQSRGSGQGSAARRAVVGTAGASARDGFLSCDPGV